MNAKVSQHEKRQGLPKIDLGDGYIAQVDTRPWKGVVIWFTYGPEEGADAKAIYHYGVSVTEEGLENLLKALSENPEAGYWRIIQDLELTKRTGSGEPVPDGWRWLPWEEAEKGVIVGITGRGCGKVIPYGKYRVVNKHYQMLENQNGVRFRHFAEDLIVEEGGLE